jgi:hypothetical protein
MNRQQSQTDTVEHPGARKEAEIHLQGAWLVLVRIAWVAVSLLAVGLFAASLPSYFAYLHIPTTYSINAPQLTQDDVHVLLRLGLSPDFYAWLNIGVYVIMLLVYVLVGFVLFLRKSDDRLALLASISLVLFPAAFSTQIVGTLPASWTLPAEIVALLGDVCLGLFFFVFPSGRFVPRWTSLLMAVWIAYWTISALFPQSALANFSFFFLLLPGMVICLIVLQVYRYRRVSTPMQRQQTKWVIAGFAISFGPLVIGQSLDYTLLTQLFPKSSLVVTLVLWCFDLLLLVFPLSLGFAILRYRLWDIDVLVNRALVYGILTVSLGLIYAGLVIVFQSLFRELIRQTNGVVIVASTLVIAALFQPLRHRIQRIIDRRFYRRKYDAAKIVEEFSATLRNEVDLNQLREQLLNVVQETMQPAHVSLWLRPPAHQGTHWVPWRANPFVPSEDEERDER